MADLPARVHIREEGPREGFQIEAGPISTADKVALIDALSDTGLRHIQTVSFVSPKAVPGWADADRVVEGFKKNDGVEYTALWFNERGAQQALQHRDKLHLVGTIAMVASEIFLQKNLRRTKEQHFEATLGQSRFHVAHAIPIEQVGVMAAFGCNYSGDVPVAAVMEEIEDGLKIAAEVGARITQLGLADSMGWCTPVGTERLVGEVRSRWPELDIVLHLHDTRGQGLASAYAALKMGVQYLDSTVAGLGGCPFAGQPGATGNIASEELVMLCQELGIETGVDLDALIEAGRLAERIVGHPLPSTLLRSTPLSSCRQRVSA